MSDKVVHLFGGPLPSCVTIAALKRAKKILSEIPLEPTAWQCAGCGYSSMKLMGDGTVVCWECQAIQSRRHFDPMEKP